MIMWFISIFSSEIVVQFLYGKKCDKYIKTEWEAALTQLRAAMLRTAPETLRLALHPTVSLLTDYDTWGI